MAKYHFVSWDYESINHTIQNGSRFNALGARLYKGKSEGHTKTGRSRKITKNGRATHLYNIVNPGDYVIVGMASEGLAFAVLLVEDRISQDGGSNIQVADSTWQKGIYTATHKTRLLSLCPEGVDVSEFKRENAKVKGRMEFGVDLGDGHLGKAGVVRQIEKSDFEGMRDLINQKVTTCSAQK